MSKAPIKSWTDAERDDLVVLHAEGLSWSEIGSRYGVSAAAAKWQYHARRSGLPMTAIASLHERAKALWAVGKNTAEIAHALSLSEAEVHNSQLYREAAT